MRKHLGMTAVLAGAFGLMTMASPAHAHTESGLQTTGDRPSGRLAGACKDDVKKFCGDVKPGGGAIRDCLKQHQADLSQACKDNIAEAKKKFKEKAEEVKAACKQDLQTYCANVTPGEGREIACLRAYSDKVSAGCKEKLPKPGMHKGMHKRDVDGDEHEEAKPPLKM